MTAAPLVSVADAARNLTVLDAITESARDGRTRELPLDTARLAYR